MSRTLTLEGDLATVDLRTALTTQGSVTAPSTVIPAGQTMIKRIIVAAATEGLADGASVFMLRIGGNAVKGGESSIVVAAAGRIAPQAGSDSAPQYCKALVLDDVDIEVTPSDTISLSAEMMGVDTGTGHIVATLFFGS